MTDLTEQWKKGELPEGFYFVSDGAEITIDYYLCDYWERHFDSDVQQVLAPVPSYKEYISLVNWKEDLTELCTVKERIIEKYENIDTWWKAEYTELKEENAQLKELLKECREPLEVLAEKRDACDWCPENLLAKIEEVLK